MLAADLVEVVPTVTPDTTGAEAARLIAEFRLPGLVVADAAGAAQAVIPGSQLLGVILPQYVRDDASLAHAFDEAAADQLCLRLGEVTLGQLLDARRVTAATLPSVLPEATLIELASVMDSGHLPIMTVVDRSGTYHGVVLLSRLLAAIATAAGEDSALVRRRMERDLIERAPGREELP